MTAVVRLVSAILSHCHAVTALCERENPGKGARSDRSCGILSSRWRRSLLKGSRKVFWRKQAAELELQNTLLCSSPPHIASLLLSPLLGLRSLGVFEDDSRTSE